MSTLSDEQMAVVHAGTARKISWEPVPLPTGRQAIPDWCLGLHVDWNTGVSNTPDVRLKVAGRVHDWEGKRFTKEGSKSYIARHPDGRLCVDYHDGAVSPCMAYRIVDTEPWPDPHHVHHAWKTWRIVEPVRGTPIEETAQKEGDKSLARLKECGLFSPAATVEVKASPATTQQQGYGGAVSWITLEDGRELALRGPWHGGAPAGYVEVTTCDWNTYGNVAILGRTSEYKWLGRRECVRPWHQRGAGYGLYISEDLFLRLVAHFAPHALALRVTHSYGVRLELADADWGGLPKTVIYEAERMRAVHKEPASRFWRMYWDSRGSYCGSLRMPEYGWEDDVTDRITPEYVKSVKPRW
jgi:hypothetical protein